MVLFKSIGVESDYGSTSINYDFVRTSIQSILNNVFEDGQKRTIVDLDDRLNFACPFCKDSLKNLSSKRGNMYLESLSYHCFNCGVHMTLKHFLEDFKDISTIDIESLGKMDFSYHHVEKKIKDYNIFNLNDACLLDKEDLMERLGFESTLMIEGYLRKRMQYDFKKFAFDRKSNAVIIFNLTEDGKVMGFQKRLLNKNVTNKYLSYKLLKIYTDLNIPITPEIEKYNNLSLIFNILNIDLNNMVTIFEGPMDSFLFKNSISLSGVHKNLPLNFDYKRFWFDNDIVGKKKTIDMLESGESVFLWKKFLKDYDITAYMKDLNDLVIYLYKYKKIKVNNNLFNDYFSENKMDIVYV